MDKGTEQTDDNTMIRGRNHSGTRGLGCSGRLDNLTLKVAGACESQIAVSDFIDMVNAKFKTTFADSDVQMKDIEV